MSVPHLLRLMEACRIYRRGRQPYIVGPKGVTADIGVYIYLFAVLPRPTNIMGGQLASAVIYLEVSFNQLCNH